MRKLVLQLIYSVLLRWFLKLIVGVRFGSARFLKNEEQFILVANHNSHLDTMTLMASLPASIVHKVRPVAAKDHFGKNKFMAWFSNLFINTLLIERKKEGKEFDEHPVDKMVEALDKGYSLIVFPEGSRGEPEREQELKPGVGLVLAQRPEIKYVPAFMKGMGNAMPKGDNLLVPFNSSLRFGKPASIDTPAVNAILQQIQDDFDNLKNEPAYY